MAMTTVPPQQEVQLIVDPRRRAELERYSESREIVEAFARVLQSETAARSYIGSVMISVFSKPGLQNCSAKSIMTEAMRSAVLGLSVDPALRQAHIVPYKGEAKLIVDYHGLVELMDRTGLYDTINVTEYWEGETVKTDRLTGKVTFDGNPILDAKGMKIIAGWVAYFKMKSGREYYLAMSNAECDAHGKKYNPSGYAVAGGVWEKEKDKMRRETCLRCLANKWATYSAHATAVLNNDDVIISELTELPDEDRVTGSGLRESSKPFAEQSAWLSGEKVENDKDKFQEFAKNATRFELEDALTRTSWTQDERDFLRGELARRPSEQDQIYPYNHAIIASAVAQAWGETPFSTLTILKEMFARGEIPEDTTIPKAVLIKKPAMQATPERPYSPAVFLEKFTARVTDYETKNLKCTEIERRVVASAIGGIFNGEETMRYEVCQWLVGVSSTGEMSPAQIHALLKTMAITGFNQAPSAHSMTEFRAAHAEALKAKGQLEFSEGAIINAEDLPY